ncbi:MAG: T9SS type A sorting domain-containing protein, partial [Paludibacter sp.]
CFESDNDGTGTTATPFTSAVFSNVSSFGPKVTTSTTVHAKYASATHIRRSSKLQIFNSVFAGWPKGLLVDGVNSQAYATAGDLKVRNSVMSGMGVNFAVGSTTTWDVAAAGAWYNTSSFKNALFTANTELGVVDPFNLAAPKFNLTAGSVLNTKSYWDNTSGISESKASVGSLALYPNPAQSEVTVIMPFELNSAVSIQIMDVTGREVYSKQSISMEKENINISNLSNGVYIVVAKQADVKLTQKLFVSK